MTVIYRLLFNSNKKKISQKQRTKYNLNPENPHIHRQVKIEAKGISVQQDVTPPPTPPTPDCSILFHTFPSISSLDAIRCIQAIWKSRTLHLLQPIMPQSTPLTTVLFIYDLECNKFRKYDMTEGQIEK